MRAIPSGIIGGFRKRPLRSAANDKSAYSYSGGLLSGSTSFAFVAVCDTICDLPASSTYDEANLYVCRAKETVGDEFPKLTLATVFEVVTGGRVYRVTGPGLQGRIVQNWVR